MTDRRAGSAAAAAATPVAASPLRRARVLGVLSIVLGAASFAFVPSPLPSAFPWLTLLLSLGGIVAAIATLRSRPRGRVARWLGWAGLAVSLALPLLVVFVFVRYLNFS